MGSGVAGMVCCPTGGHAGEDKPPISLGGQVGWGFFSPPGRALGAAWGSVTHLEAQHQVLHGLTGCEGTAGSHSTRNGPSAPPAGRRA